MNILGLNAYHGDSAACLLRDGRVIAAAEEERFRRVKHWAGFPSRSIAWCLQEAGITLGDIDCIAINSDSRARLLDKLRHVLRHRPPISLITARLRNRRKRQSIKDELAHAFPGQTFRGRVLHVEHHRAHMASAFLVSPFEQASVLSIDGFGDFSSAAWGVGNGNSIDIEGRVLFPHSLGIFY